MLEVELVFRGQLYLSIVIVESLLGYAHDLGPFLKVNL